MMLNKNKRNSIQNTLIFLLSVSALFLLYLTQSGPLGLSLPHALLSRTPSDAVTVSGESAYLQEMDWPVTVLTFGADGTRRYQHLSTDDSDFTSVESLLEDALKAMPEWESADGGDFRAAMDGESLCVLFPCGVPVYMLGARLGLELSESRPVSRILFSLEDGVVRLYCSDGQSCVRTISPVLPEIFHEVVAQKSGEPCLLADEYGEEASRLDALTVCPTDLPLYPLLTAETAGEVRDEASLLTAFGFNAHTNNRYTEADGTKVIVESPRQLRITNGGTVQYQGDAKNAPELFSFGEKATVTELAGGTYRLLQRLLGESRNDFRLYLSAVEQNGERCIFHFEAMAGGLPVLSANGESAAAVTLEKGTVTELTLRYRRYSVSDGAALLLPFRQALAAAVSHAGLRMDLSYIDSGAETASLSWFMR